MKIFCCIIWRKTCADLLDQGIFAFIYNLQFFFYGAVDCHTKYVESFCGGYIVTIVMLERYSPGISPTVLKIRPSIRSWENLITLFQKL